MLTKCWTLGYLAQGWRFSPHAMQSFAFGVYLCDFGESQLLPFVTATDSILIPSVIAALYAR